MSGISHDGRYNISFPATSLSIILISRYKWTSCLSKYKLTWGRPHEKGWFLQEDILTFVETLTCVTSVYVQTKLIVIVQISICIFPNTKSFIFRDLPISYKCRKLSFADKLCRLFPLLSLAFRTCKFVFVNPAICISKCWFYRICGSCYLYMGFHALLNLCVLLYVFVHPCFVLSANPDVCIPECLLCYIYD